MNDSVGLNAIFRARYRVVLMSLLALLCLLLTGCATSSGIPVDVVGYNHTDHSIGSFTVDDSGGSFLQAHKGGGKFTCCILVPREYQAGMTVKIGWTDEAGENPQERNVPVPLYRPSEIGEFAVHFLKDGQIKVFVTIYGLRHPNSPLKGEEAKL